MVVNENEPGDDDGDELSLEELARERGEKLPDRAVMSSLDADVTIPFNPALAADVLTGPSDDDDLGEVLEPDEPDDPDREAPGS